MKNLLMAKNKTDSISTNPLKGRNKRRKNVYQGKSLLSKRAEPEHVIGAARAIGVIKKGISQKELLNLKNETELDYEKLSFIVGVTRQTLAKKDESYTYQVSESDKIFRLAALYSYGYDVFENKEGFNLWMRTENAALGNVRPIDFLDTAYGFQEVKDLIGRIDYGVYS